MAKFFTYFEFIKSETAERMKINNEPETDEVKDNIIQLMRVMDMIRERWAEYCYDNHLFYPQIIITSGYRSEALNKAVGGSKTSAHRCGSACDFVAKNGHNKELFQVCLEVLRENGIQFEELINEQNYSWIHFALQDCNGNRKNEVFAL